MSETIEVVTSGDTTIEIVVPRNIDNLTIIVKKAPQTSHKHHHKTNSSNAVTSVPSTYDPKTYVTNPMSNVQRTTKTSRSCPAKPFTARWTELQRKHIEKPTASSKNDNGDNLDEVDDDDDTNNDDSSYVYESESNTDSENSL